MRNDTSRVGYGGITWLNCRGEAHDQIADLSQSRCRRYSVAYLCRDSSNVFVYKPKRYVLRHDTGDLRVCILGMQLLPTVTSKGTFCESSAKQLNFPLLWNLA